MGFLDLSFLVLDTETTGLDPEKDKVVEIAVVIVRPDGPILHQESWLVNPGIPIPPIASSIHHLVDDDVAEAPSIEVIQPQVEALRQRFQVSAMVAHNGEYDFAMLPWLQGVPKLCTWRFARHLWPNSESHTNQYLRYAHKLEVPPEIKGLAAHRALADALVTAKLFQFEVKEVLSRAKHPEAASVDALAAWQSRPVLLQTCRFGKKHYGVPWCDVPVDYLKYMIDRVLDMDPDTKHTVYHYYDLKVGQKTA